MENEFVPIFNFTSDLGPPNVLTQVAGRLAQERAEWIESVLSVNVPKWKVWVLKRYPFLKPFLSVNVKIINEPLILARGCLIRIELNGKVIEEKEYKYD